MQDQQHMNLQIHVHAFHILIEYEQGKQQTGHSFYLQSALDTRRSCLGFGQQASKLF